jgi:GNAT superfamily N-acetyltransferase
VTNEPLIALERNAVEGNKSWSAWPGLEYFEEPGLAWTLTDVTYPIYNSVLTFRTSPEEAEGQVDRILGMADRRNVPMAWWTLPSTRPANLGKLLTARGFVEAEQNVGMFIDLDRAPEKLVYPPALNFEEVLDDDIYRTWSEVMGEVFAFPDFALDAWIDVHRTIGFGRDKVWRYFLARFGDLPVATSSIFTGAGVAGVASVAVRPEFRGMGIGAAITLYALRAGREAGLRMGVLFASPAGRSMYERLGFKELCRSGLWMMMEEL